MVSDPKDPADCCGITPVMRGSHDSSVAKPECCATRGDSLRRTIHRLEKENLELRERAQRAELALVRKVEDLAMEFGLALGRVHNADPDVPRLRADLAKAEQRVKELETANQALRDGRDTMLRQAERAGAVLTKIHALAEGWADE